jgi:hypothetical protein
VVFPFFREILTYLLSFFLYSKNPSSIADRSDAPQCVPVPCKGENLLSNEDCTKTGCRSTPCSFVEARHGKFIPHFDSIGDDER